VSRLPRASSISSVASASDPPLPNLFDLTFFYILPQYSAWYHPLTTTYPLDLLSLTYTLTHSTTQQLNDATQPPANNHKMRFWRLIPKPVPIQANAARATLRDDVLSIGPEGYAEFNLVSRRRMASWSLETSPSPRQLEAASADSNTTSRATTAPPTEDGDATSKRPASTQPADQPDSKRARVSTPSPPTRRFANTALKRRALTQPADQPVRKRARVFIPADASGGDAGFDEAPVPPTRYADAAAKRHALKQLVGQPDANKDRVYVPADRSGGRGGFDEMLSPFFPDVMPTLSDSTEVSGEGCLKPEQAGMAGIGAKGKDKTDSNKVDKDKLDKNKNDKNKVDSDSDSDCVEVVESMSTPATKGKSSTAARSASAKKSKGKRSEPIETPDVEDSPSARKSTFKASSGRGKSVSQAVNLDGSEAEDDEAEDEEDDEESEDEDEDPQVARKKILQAEKNLSKVCRSCKINANKQWKDKYDAMVSRLNSEHKTAIRDLKADKIEALKKAKATADKEKKAAKAKADEAVENVRDTLEERFDAMKGKLDGEIKTLKRNLTAEKTKVTDLKSEVDRVEAQRKKIERDAAEQVKKAENDLKAGAAEQREKGKQLSREKQAEIDQWKPQLSNAVKAKDKNIKELTQKVLEREKELERSEEDLRNVRTLRATEKNHHEHTLKKLEEHKAHVDELADQILKYERHNKAIEVRARLDVTRAEEETVTARANLQQQSNKLVDKQRENYLLSDAMRTHAKLAEERKREVENLKKQLRDARAELEVAVGIEDMEVVEVGKGEGVKGEAVKGETTETA
jgi:hypothetical protein